MSALGHKRTYAVQNGMSALTPESGHVRCTSLCPLSAKSGHVTLQFDCAERRLTDGRTALMSIGKQRRLKRVVELINSKSWLFTLVTALSRRACGTSYRGRSWRRARHPGCGVSVICVATVGPHHQCGCAMALPFAS